MSFVKSKLKLARDALGKKDYQAARDAANQVLEYEPDNYNATVFLGLASLELGDLEKSEQSYRRAIDANPRGILAWQGISRFYERIQDQGKLLDALRHIANIHAQSDDAIKCAETLQKYIQICRESGSIIQIVEALSLLRPGSTFYPILSNIPPPDPTNPTSTTISTIQNAIHDSLPILEEVVSMLEKDETERVKKDFENRRLRLGEARNPEQLRKAVDLEVLGSSQLPRLYDEILNHPNTSDDLRRSTEAKLLRHTQRYLYAIPATTESAVLKSKIAGQLESLINGVVLLGIPDELAWNIFIDCKDCDAIEGYDFHSLRQFLNVFPGSPMTALIKGYFSYSSVSCVDAEQDDEKTTKPETDVDDALDMILDAFTSLHDSIFANRVLADIYTHEVDYPNAIKMAESGLELVNRAEANYGKKLPDVRKAFKVVLSTSLVHFYPPKHHQRALRIINEVLHQDPNNIACLMAHGYILEAASKWAEACKFFTRVVGLIPHELDNGLRAKEEQAWCQVQIRNYENGLEGLHGVLDSLSEVPDRDLDKARCLWRLGLCHWELNDNREESYRLFIQALKSNPEYAPAFTSLGIYYLECADPPDPTRATKCFQKAFELDARETEAARRLAESFAAEREWDLVEVVAQRTIDGEGGSEAGMTPTEGSAMTRYLPTNSWAWKAVGIVELIHRNYENAIRALQVALRADANDHLSWLRLGEAYSSAGRHAAAMKALERARELMPSDWMCVYLIGNVQRQVGRYQEAIDLFTSIVNHHHPSEVGVLMSLAQAHLDLGRMEISSGFSSRAEQSFNACIRASLRAIDASPGFRAVAWKTAADALYDLSGCPSFKVEGHYVSELGSISVLLSSELSDRVSGVILSSSLQNVSSFNEPKVLAIAVAAYDYRVSLTSSEGRAVGAAFYDLGIALRGWGRKSTSLDGELRANQQAILCLKEALRQEPGSILYWNALGTLHFENAKIAQHSYIKALEIDCKDVVSWTNLGLLYLYHGDLELANEAFYRAQTLDPDYQVAWLGQALVATAHGHDTEADAMFEHAVDLPSLIPEADLVLASRSFTLQSDTKNQRSISQESLFPAFFVLDRYCRRRPNDAAGLHLYGLVCESVGQVESGIEQTRRAIAILEADYEETEAPLIERQFTIATSNLARMLLCIQDYEGALEAFTSVLGLLPDNDDDQKTRMMRIQAHFGSGLANFYLRNLEEALTMFEAALESAKDNVVVKGHVTVLLAQTLWALDTEESRESAKNQLLQSISDYPDNLAAINTLAGMGIVTEDDTLVDAALSEILSLPLDQRHEKDPARDVDYVLKQHHLSLGDTVQALSVAQKAVHAEPSRSEVRQDVASLLIQQGEFQPALAVFAGSSSENNVDAPARLRAIAESLVLDASSRNKETAIRQAQRAVKLFPSQIRNWETLAFVRAQCVE